MLTILGWSSPTTDITSLVYILSHKLDLTGYSAGNIAWHVSSEMMEILAPVSTSMTSGLPSMITSQVNGFGFEEVPIAKDAVHLKHL